MRISAWFAALVLGGIACSPAASEVGGSGVASPTAGIEGELHGAFLELECESGEIEMQFCVPRDMGKRSLMLRFAGEAGRTYAVVLRVWGVVEAVKYEGGEKTAPHLYVGGRSATPDTAEYTLEVAGQRYQLNHFDNNAGEHYTYAMEYTTPPIPIPGATTLRLSVDSPDDLVNTNHMETAVAAPPPALRQKLEKMQDDPLDWQYVYLEVASLREM